MYATNAGVRLFWQATGDGPDLFLCPQCQPVTYSRMWKEQIPYLSRYFRVVTMDPRGNGRSDRPATGYDFDTRYGDLLAVLDEAVRPAVRPGGVLVRRACSRSGTRSTTPTGCRTSIVLSGQYAESVPQPFEEKVARVIRDDFDGWRQSALHRDPARAALAEGRRGLHGVGRRDHARDPRRVAPRHRRVNVCDLLGRIRRADARAPRHPGPDRPLLARAEDRRGDPRRAPGDVRGGRPRAARPRRRSRSTT